MGKARVAADGVEDTGFRRACRGRSEEEREPRMNTDGHGY